MIRTVIGTLADADFAKRYDDPMFNISYIVFHERLNWDVRCHDVRDTD